MVMGFFGDIDNHDAPIHRFIRLPYFGGLLQGELVFVTPTAWDDPYEFLAQRSMITDQRSTPWRQYPISSVMENVFGQSWSLNEDSDTYLRAYSSVRKDPSGRNLDSEFESVRITTTPGKLQNAVERAVTAIGYRGEAFVFTSRVKYVDPEVIKSTVASAVNQNLATALERAKTTADLCLLKRRSFLHEQEVRSLVIFSNSEQSTPLLTLRVEPSDLIEAISFDPRLTKSERLARARLLKGSPLEACVVDGDQYQGVLLEIIVS